jgi:hypothetical protein
MTRKGSKQEPPLHLDMDFGEALERFARTRPSEVAESVERSKQKAPENDETPRREKRSTERETSPSGRTRKRSGD